MSDRKINLLVFMALILAVFAACEKISDSSDDDAEDDDPDVYTFDTTTVVQITLSSTSITVVPEVADISGSKVTITSAGTYKVSGSLTDGQIIVNTKNKGNVRLILNGVNIKCSDSSPLYIKDSDKVLLNLADGTVNYLTDGASYVTESGEPSATLFSNSDLTIYGEGSLTVFGNYADGISSDDGLLIKSGTISVTSADDGIRGKDYLHIQNGNFTVNSKGDALKSDNETDNSLGYITVDLGTFNLTSGSGDAMDAATNLTIADGIFTITTGGGAGTSISSGGSMPGGGGSSGGYSGTISEKAIKGGASVKIDKGTFTINAADDALHSTGTIIINGGTINAATGDDGVHGETSIVFNGGTLNISKCYEGIEGPSITVNGGNIILASTDDGFNATRGSATESDDGSTLYIKGGYIVVNSTTGDAFDSNGSIWMSAGTVILHGPKSSPEVAFDVNGSFIISGGFLIASGPNSGNMIETPAANSSQYCVKATCSSTLSASALFHLEDASGNDIVTFKPVRSVYYLVISSPGFTSGSSYSIFTGGSSSGVESNGLYTGGTYLGGTLKKTFSITSRITSVSF